MTSTSQMLGVDFREQQAPQLGATPASDLLRSSLFGASAVRSFGSVSFGGSDPRVTWDLDYAEQYWIANSFLGDLLITRDQALNGGTRADAQLRVLDSIAVKLGDAVRDVAMSLGTGGLVDFLDAPVQIEPAGIRDTDVVVQRFTSNGIEQQSMSMQFRTLDPIPTSEALPVSLLVANPSEQIAFGRARFAVLRGVRTSLKQQFCLDDTAFLADEPCKLAQPVSVRLGDLSLTLDRIEATIDPGSVQKAGALIVDGQIHGPGELWGVTLFDFVSMFNMAFELDLDDVPRELEENEVWPILRSLAEINADQDALGVATCNGSRPISEIDAVSKELKEQLKCLPRTLGVSPRLRAGSPFVDSEVAMTIEGYLASIAAIALLFSGIGGGIAIASTLSAVTAVKLLLAAMISWMALRITLDQLGEYLTDDKVREVLSGDRTGSLLPKTGFLPVDLWLRDHLLVFFRELPARLDVSCVQRDDKKADDDDVLQQVGGGWPTDQEPWRITVNDGVLLVKSGQLALFSNDQPISVATSSANREYLRSDPNPSAPDNLDALPECGRFPET